MGFLGRTSSTTWPGTSTPPSTCSRSGGFPIFKNEDGHYKREVRWQIMIHGESYKPIVAEAAKAAIGEENLYERIFVAHPLLDADDPTRIAGVVGFSVRDGTR